MSYILCIETSTTNCSVALGCDGKTIVLKEDYNTSYSHAERLHCYIDQVVKEAGIVMADLQAVAVSKGPGSYTGLRIGVAAAKGLCYALDIPLISIPTLQALALQVDTANGVIIPMIDARRMEVYSAIFKGEEQIRSTRAEILDENSFENFLHEEKVHFIGNGVEKFKSICTQENAIFIENKLPSANEMVLLSSKKYTKKEFEVLSLFEPYYLKEFVTG